MKVTLWGTRGSIPTAMSDGEIRRKIVNALTVYKAAGAPDDIDDFVASLPFTTRSSFGGETCCVQIDHGSDECLILDAGSGLRVLGLQLMTQPKPPTVYHIVLSHFHWDHIQGLPFFAPCYIPGNVVHFYALHDGFQEALENQQKAPYFPVDMEYMRAEFRFHPITQDEAVEIDGCTLQPFRLEHPQGSFGYTIEKDGKKCVYASDCEYMDMTASVITEFIGRYNNSDLLIFDAQYNLEEATGAKYTWGHSHFGMGVDFARLAGIKTLCFYHHDPTSSDERLADLHARAIEYRDLTFGPDEHCDIHWGYDGIVFDL